jgi:hypothetical protein
VSGKRPSGRHEQEGEQQGTEKAIQALFLDGHGGTLLLGVHRL